MPEYIPKAKTTMIKFSSRASVKIRDNFYTMEYGEERQIENIDNVDIDKEIQVLVDKCNDVVDTQIDETIKAILNPK